MSTAARRRSVVSTAGARGAPGTGEKGPDQGLEEAGRGSGRVHQTHVQHAPLQGERRPLNDNGVDHAGWGRGSARRQFRVARSHWAEPGASTPRELSRCVSQGGGVEDDMHFLVVSLWLLHRVSSPLVWSSELSVVWPFWYDSEPVLAFSCLSLSESLVVGLS